MWPTIILCLGCLAAECWGGVTPRQKASDQTASSIVAVGRGRGLIRLATPRSATAWRTVDITLDNAQTVPDMVRLYSTGTKLLVVNQGHMRIADLTMTPPAWQPASHSHTLPGERLLWWSDRTVIDGRDDNHTSRRIEFDSPIRAVADGGGRIAVLDDARLLVILKDESRLECALPPFIGDPQGLVYQQAAGTLAASFFVVTSPSQGPRSGNYRAYNVLEHDSTCELGASPIRVESLLHARLLSSTAGLPATEADYKAAAALAEALASSGAFEWEVQRIRPEPELYVPVLQLADIEKVYPAHASIWRNIVQQRTVGEPSPAQQQPQIIAPGVDEQVLFKTYLDAQRFKPSCGIYYKVLSYPGTWLYQFWLYYPFDYGGVASHLHDPEHLFVEVDKLRGQPINVLASAHSNITASNFYSTYIGRRGRWTGHRADPPLLPLFAIVELGKHATAPDINRDGVLTIGRDINTYSEAAHVWGIRDHIGDTDSHFGGFRTAQMAPRQHNHRIASSAYARFFPSSKDQMPELAVPDRNRICRLTEFPGKEASDDKTMNSYEQAAIRKLVGHSDARVPERILKTWYAPHVHLRAGVGRVVGTGGFDLSLGAALQLQQLTAIRGIGRFLPSVPGRIAAEVQVTTPHSRDAERTLQDFSGRQFRVFGRENVSVARVFGLRFERHLSNHFGYHLGAHHQWRKWRFDNPALGRDVFSDNGWLWRVGPMWDYPVSKSVGFLFHAAGVVRNGPIQDWGIEVRLSYIFYSRRGRGEFGIR